MREIGSKILKIKTISRENIGTPYPTQNADFSINTIKELITQGENKALEIIIIYSCITNTGIIVLSITFLTVIPITLILDDILLLAITIKSISDSSENFIISSGGLPANTL